MESKLRRAQSLLAENKPDKAIGLLHPILKQIKNNRSNTVWPAYHMMGIALSQKGNHEGSARYLKKALDHGSSQPETYHMLSVNYYNLGKLEEAIEYGREAVERRSSFLKAWLNLGSVYRAQAKLEEALKCYKRANKIDPQNSGVAFRVGAIYRDLGDLNKALQLFDTVLKMDENDARAILAKAEIYKKKGNYEKAKQMLERAGQEDSEPRAVKVSEAELYKAKGDYDRTLEIYETMLESEPNNAILRSNYALALQEISRFDESEKNYRKAISNSPEVQAPMSNYLMGLHYNPTNSKEQIYEEHIRLADKFFSQKQSGRPVPRDTTKDKKLKVGFVSDGFRSHPVGWMITGALEQLRDDQLEIYCYTTNNVHDFVTRRIHQNTDVWRSIVGYDSKVVAGIIEDDELDILVDLSGHSENSRLEVMAREPAPIIAKWVGGLFNTTGLDSIDFLITDWHETPEGEEDFYTEKLVRLPDDYISYTPPDYVSEPSDLPAKENGYVTFGCFNNPTKVNEVVLAHWATIMNELPESRLFLKSKQYETSSFKERIIEILESEGVDGDRVIFQGGTPHKVHLEAYNRVDIALDPWPYSGGLTTCEALYMGVPVITMPGPTFAGRHSTTHLINTGLEQWVTGSWEEYAEKTVALASDWDELENWRMKLRDQLLNSPLGDGKRLGAHLSVAFREMWEQWVDGYENNIEDWQDHIKIEPLSDEKIEELTDGPDKTPLLTQKNGKSGNESTDLKEKSVQERVKMNNHNEEKNNSSIESDLMTARSNGKQNDNYCIDTKDDVTICTPDDLDILTSYVLLEQEEWFEPELNFVRDYLRHGMNAVDIGASFGGYALPMAKQVGKEGAVYAFEPGAIARKYLEKSKAENNFDHLEIIGRAAGDEIGEVGFDTAKTPELNTVSLDSDQKVSQTTLDTWWNFAGQPELDLIKIDVNGMESQVLQGASKMLDQTSPVVLVSIGENGESLTALRDKLEELGFSLYEYIPGPRLLAEYDPEAGVDPYLMNIIAIKEDRIQEHKDSGWIFDENVNIESADSLGWKQILEKQPWSESKISEWESEVKSGDYEEYIEALNLASAAEQMAISDEDPQSRSRKGITMLVAAQKLIGILNNSGKAGISAAMTYVRVMNQLGKRGQAVDMMEKIMQTVNSGSIDVPLPFLLPLPEQDDTAIKTDFPKWLTVRVVEAWITLQNPTTYMAGKKENKMLEVLEGNPEVVNEMRKSVQLKKNRDEFDLKRIAPINNEGKSVPLKHLYLGYPGKKGGAHGIHEIRAQKLIHEIKKKEIGVSVVSTSEPEFLEALIAVKNNKGYACYSGVMGYDLKVNADMGISGNAFDLLNIPVFAFLGDHPYTEFMWNRIASSSDNTVFLTSIPSLKNEMEKIFPSRSVRLLDNLFPLSNQQENLPPIKKRSIDVLIPWGLHKFFTSRKSLDQKLKDLGPMQRKIGLALYEKALHNYQDSILKIFLELYESQFGNRYQFLEKKTKQDFRWLKVLSLVDWTIRKDRRIAMLREQVAILPEKYRVVVTASQMVSKLIPELKGKNIEWIEEVNKGKLNQLYRDSKILLNCNPTYLDNVHPRVYEGFENGCFVVSDANNALKEIFLEKDAIGIVGNDENEKKLIDYLTEDWKKLEEKVDWGQKIVQQSFSAEKHVESLLRVITEEI